MPYDFDGAEDRSATPVFTMDLPKEIPAHDYASIVMAIELAALCLTPRSDSEFTLEQLLDEVCAMGCADRGAAAHAAERVPFLEQRGERLRLVEI